MNIDIKYSPKLEFSPVYTFFLKVHADFIDKGIRYPITTWKDRNHEVVYCYIEDKIVGFINYTNFVEEYKLVMIDICYVNIEYRNQGILKQMIDYLEEKLKEQGATALRVDVPSQDPSLEEVFKSLGFATCFYSLHKKVS